MNEVNAFEIHETGTPTYRFPALRAVQAGWEYYTVVLPFAVLEKIVRAELRRESGIVSEKTKSKAIADYIVENQNNFVLPPLTISINADYSFKLLHTETDEISSGHLILSPNADLRIHDGRQRAIGIVEAIHRVADISNETVPVIFFPRNGGSTKRFDPIQTRHPESSRS